MTGKTQISHELARQLGVHYYKATSEHHAFMNDPDRFINDIRYADPRLIDFIRQTKTSVVMDRGFPCQYAYAKVLGRDNDPGALARVDDGYAALGAKVIWCHRQGGYDGIFDDLDPVRINPTTLQALHEAYEEYITKQMKCRYLALPVDDENLDREVSEILKFLNE